MENRVLVGKVLISSNTSPTTPGFSFDRLREGTRSRLERFAHLAAFDSEGSEAKLCLPIRASLKSKAGSLPILTPDAFSRVLQSEKTSSTVWHTGTLSVQSSQ